MRERERKAIRTFMEEERAEQQRQREEAERPIKEAQAQFDQNFRELHTIQRERVLTQRDEQFSLDMSTTKPIPIDQVPEWQRNESALFKRRYPDYWPTPENEAVLVDYINRNHPGIRLVSALQLSQAYIRLKGLGLFQERPTPASEPTQEPEPVTPPQPAAPVGHQGWDLETGEPRVYSEFEVNRMDSTDYKRRFRLSQPKITDVLFPGN